MALNLGACIFRDIEHGRAWCGEFFDWYNYHHQHSGLALFTPADVFYDRVDILLVQRQAALEAAYAAHPERFVRGQPHARRRVVEELHAHPLLRPLTELVACNAMTLADMGMTPKVQEEAAEEWGHLESAQQDRDALTAFAAQQATQLERLAALVERLQRATERDPVLIEHRAAEGEAGEGA